MKQIVVPADEITHAWVKELAKSEKRTMGNQVLALLGIVRAQGIAPNLATPKPRRTRKRKEVAA